MLKNLLRSEEFLVVRFPPHGKEEAKRHSPYTRSKRNSVDDAVSSFVKTTEDGPSCTQTWEPRACSLALRPRKRATIFGADMGAADRYHEAKFQHRIKEVKRQIFMPILTWERHWVLPLGRHWSRRGSSRESSAAHGGKFDFVANKCILRIKK